MSKKDEKVDVKALQEKLTVDRKNGAAKLDASVIKKADKFCEGYKDFLAHAKTEREAVTEAIRIAEEAGFVPYDPMATYKAGDRVYVNNRGKAIMLAVIGTEGTRQGVHIAAAHIDNPRLDLKPHPVFEKDGLAQFKTHYYGGIKKYQWTAIPLSMHGRICRKDGSFVDITLGEKPGEPQFTVTDLLVHLAREQLKKPLGASIEGEKLNILIGSRPLPGCGRGRQGPREAQRFEHLKREVRHHGRGLCQRGHRVCAGGGAGRHRL